MSTLKNAALPVVAAAIKNERTAERARLKATGQTKLGAELIDVYYRGKIVDTLAADEPVIELAGSLPVLAVTKDDFELAVVVDGYKISWVVKPQMPYEFEIIPHGQAPRLPAHAIDSMVPGAVTFKNDDGSDGSLPWIDLAREKVAELLKLQPAAKPAKADKSKTVVSTEPKAPGVSDLQKQINELVAAMAKPNADFAALGAQIATLKAQQDAIRAEQDAKREARLEAKKAEEAAKAEAEAAAAYQAVFQPRFDALLAARRAELETAQTALDELLTNERYDQVPAAKLVRDNARKAADVELIKSEVEQAIAAEQKPADEPAAEQLAPEAPATDDVQQPEQAPEQPPVESEPTGSEALGLTEVEQSADTKKGSRKKAA